MCKCNPSIRTPRCPKCPEGSTSPVAPSFLSRMEEEHKQLRAKLYALRGFISGKVFPSLPEKKQKLMQKQLVAMESYSDILDSRIELEK